MHPAAWIAWVLMVMVVALATTNPLYLGIVLLGVILVAVMAPRSGTGVASFRALLLFGISMLGISIVVATINGNYGDHILFTIPGPEVPEWLGGLRLGGPVSAEGLIAAAIRGVAILSVLLAFGVFNGAVSPHRVLRSTPAALFQASLVVTVGLTLLPSSIEDMRRVREMRALRGAPGGIRGLPALVIPAVVGGLERSMQLAEAMEARGYGAAPPLPQHARLAAAGSVPLLVAGAWIWFYEVDVRWVGAVLTLLAAGCLAWWWRTAARAHRTTRYGDEPLSRADRVAVWGSIAIIVAVAGLRATGRGDTAYNPFAGLAAPEFHWAGGILALAVAWPALRLAFAPLPQPTTPHVEQPEPMGLAPRSVP